MSYLVWGEVVKPEPIDGFYVLENGARVHIKAIVHDTCELGAGCTLGTWCNLGEGCNLGAGCTLGAWCNIGAWCTLGAWCNIGAGCTLGAWCNIGAGCTLGAWCELGAWCNIGAGCNIGEGCKLGEGCSVLTILTLPLWYVTIWQDQREGHGMTMRIGCQEHPVLRWRGFSDALITKMDDDALAWWKSYGPAVLSMADALEMVENARIQGAEKKEG